MISKTEPKIISNYFTRLINQKLSEMNANKNKIYNSKNFVNKCTIDPTKLPIRAENTKIQHIVSLRQFLDNHSFIDYNISGYIHKFVVNPFVIPYMAFRKYLLPTSPLNQVYFMGLKGWGKTMAMQLAVNYVIENHSDFKPLVLMFDKQKKVIYSKPPTELALPQQWGESRLCSMENCDNHNFKNYTSIILDDMHYILESIANNPSDIEWFINLLENLVNLKDKKVVLISEEPLVAYAELFNNERLNELVHKLGQYSTTNHKAEEMMKYREKINYSAFTEYPYFGLRDWIKIIKFYGKFKFAEPTIEIIYNISRTPRSIIKVIKLFKSKKLLNHNIFMKATLNRLVAMKKKTLDKGQKSKISHQINLLITKTKAETDEKIITGVMSDYEINSLPQHLLIKQYKILGKFFISFKYMSTLCNFYRKMNELKRKALLEIIITNSVENQLLKETDKNRYKLTKKGIEIVMEIDREITIRGNDKDYVGGYIFSPFEYAWKDYLTETESSLLIKHKKMR